MTDDLGEVTTFYSYKGGTGRSMALANVACILAKSQEGRVLMIDWDLEAPGLHRFFRQRIVDGSNPINNCDLNEKLGLIDLFNDLKKLFKKSKSKTEGNKKNASTNLISIDLYWKPISLHCI